MGKPPGQSEFRYVSTGIDPEEDMARHGASPLVAKVMYVVVALAFLVLFVLVAFELHVPRGE
jgi:hypothetical protein